MIASSTRKGTKLVRNPRFRVWSVDAKPDGYPDVISFSETDNPAEVKQTVAAVGKGREDVAFAIVPPLGKADVDSLATRYPGQLRFNTNSVTNFFFMNTRVAPFNDVRARQAVNYAIDRGALVALLGRTAAPTCQIFPT